MNAGLILLVINVSIVVCVIGSILGTCMSKLQESDNEERGTVSNEPSTRSNDPVWNSTRRRMAEIRAQVERDAQSSSSSSSDSSISSSEPSSDESSSSSSSPSWSSSFWNLMFGLEFSERPRQQMQRDIESIDVIISRFSTNESSAVSGVSRLNMIRLQREIIRAQMAGDSDSFEANMQNIDADIDRKTLIRSKLHYQIVLEDRSNANIESLRDEEAATMTDISLDDGDDSSTIASNRVEQDTTSLSTSLFHRVQDMFSLRSLRPRKKDICSICLEEFKAGQTICAAKNASCNHIFHAQCLQSWLMEHDDCPNCRRVILD